MATINLNNFRVFVNRLLANPMISQKEKEAYPYLLEHYLHEAKEYCGLNISTGWTKDTRSGRRLESRGFQRRASTLALNMTGLIIRRQRGMIQPSLRARATSTLCNPRFKILGGIAPFFGPATGFAFYVPVSIANTDII